MNILWYIEILYKYEKKMKENNEKATDWLDLIA